MKKIVIILIIFNMYGILDAQEFSYPSLRDSNHIFQMIGFGIGAGFIKHSEFDKFTDSYEWKNRFINTFLYMNGEIGLFLKNTYISLDINLPISGNKNGNDKAKGTASFNLERYLFSLKLGYTINLNRKFLIIPNFSYGYSYNILTYEKKIDFGNEINFNDALDKRQFSIDIFGSTPFFVPAIDLSMKFPKLILSLSFKYYFCETSIWQVKSTSVNGIPDFDFSGFYLGLQFRFLVFDYNKLISGTN